MHTWSKKIMENVKEKVESIGIDNLDDNNIFELGKWTDIAKDIAECDYYCSVVDAMEKSGGEYGKDYDYRGKIDKPTMDEMLDMLSDEIHTKHSHMTPTEIAATKNKIMSLNNMLM